MIYSLAEIRTYMREDLDNRLSDVNRYPDAWIDRRIEEGMAYAQDLKQIFTTREKYDMTTSFAPVVDGGDGLTEVEIILQREPHSVYAVECDLTYFEVEVTANNHVVLRKISAAPDVPDKTVTVRYFYYPLIPFTDIEMSMEMWRLVKESIAVICYGKLQDKENEQYYTGRAESMIVKSTLDIEKDLLKIDDGRLWRQSWV